MGNLKLNIVDIELTNQSYLVGGIEIPSAKLGVTAPMAVNPMPAAGYVFEFDHLNKKLKAFPAAVKPFVTYTGVDIKGSNNTDAENADADSAPTNDEGIAGYSAVGPVAQVIKLTVTEGASASENVTITLDETIETTVAVLAEDDAATVAGKIRAASITGWTITGAEDNAIFTADVAEAKGVFSFDGGDTGVVATIEETTEGSDSAWTVDTISSPDIARNVCIVIKANGANRNLFEGVMSFTVTGLCNGVSVSDTITFESDETDQAVVVNKFRIKYGVQPFDTIEDVLLDNMPENGTQIAVGLGSKVGLPGGIDAESDIIKVTLNAADYDFEDKVDEVNNTLNLSDIADDADFTITHKASGGFAGSDTGMMEVAVGTLITATIRCIAIGL